MQDDCSEDETIETLSGYVQTNVRIFLNVNTTNLGVWRNYSTTLEKARGDYVIWLCPGEIMLPHFIESCMRTMLDVKEAVAVTTAFQEVDEVTREQINTAVHRTRPQTHVSGLRGAWSMLRKTNPGDSMFIHGLLKTDVIRKAVRSFGGSGSILNERMVLSQLALAGSFVGIEEVLYVKEIHSESSFSRKPHDPGRQANLMPFWFTRWTTKMIWSITRSRAVPFRYKILFPVLIFLFLARNFWVIALIRAVPILKRNIPDTWYLLLRKAWRRLTSH